jgi:transposase
LQPYHPDLRTRVVESYKTGEGPCSVLAQRYKISRATAYNYVRKARLGEGLLPKKRALSARRAINDPEIQQVVISLVQEQNDATLAQYCKRLEDRAEIRFSETRMCRFLKKLNLPRKKNGSRNGA